MQKKSFPVVFSGLCGQRFFYPVFYPASRRLILLILFLCFLFSVFCFTPLCLKDFGVPLQLLVKLARCEIWLVAETPKMAERPLECSECKKPIAVVYTQIVGLRHGTPPCTHHCADCPILGRRLYGSGVEGVQAGALVSQGTGLCCGDCGTTLEAVRVGGPLGCSQCYEVFGDVLIADLLATNRISSRIAVANKNKPLHRGRSPGEAPEINPAMALLALNAVLSDAVAREDFEGAAGLRDQIKALKRKASEGETQQ